MQRGFLHLKLYKNFLEKLTGLSKFRLLPLDGVDYELFSTPRKELPRLREQWSGQVLLTVGKLKERKGIDVALKAFKIVKQKIREVKYVVIGRGDMDRYRSLVSQLRLTDVFFIGNVSDGELAAFYQLCDAFILTPKRFGMDFEGFGLVYLEAGAAGKPVVASKHGGVVDVVKHMENGLLVPENDPEATAEAIMTVLTDKDLAKRLGSKGREVAMKFKWENTVDALIRKWEENLPLHYSKR
ncbi:MAG: glycosyltransferase family 4 protein [Nitrososphaerota archaeon]|nr:glycosyltransferase family 4 protein [Nitrososphaerota archaeon]